MLAAAADPNARGENGATLLRLTSLFNEDSVVAAALFDAGPTRTRPTMASSLEVPPG